MKLGLVIYNTNMGLGNLIFKDNESQDWTKFVKDERNTLKYFAGNKEVIPVVRFLGQLGYIINIIDSSKDFRPGDNTTASIFVPAMAEIDGKTLDGLINAVYEQITSQSGLDKDSLYDIFSREFNEKQVKSSAISGIQSSNNGKLGLRKYGLGTGYELSDLLGNNIAQKEYSNYEAIIFVDNATHVTPNPNMEILNGELKEIVTIYPPTNNQGFRLYLMPQGIQFDRPIEACVGDKLSMVWKRNLYSDIYRAYTIEKEDQGKQLNVSGIRDNEKKIIIPRDLFKVYDDKGIPVKSCIVALNNKQFQGDTLELLEYEFASEIKLDVKGRGYQDYSRFMRLRSLSEPFRITLKKATNTKEYLLPKGESKYLTSDAKIIIETRGGDIRMPLKGYSEINGKLIYDLTPPGFWKKIKYFLMGAATVIVIGLMVAGINLFADWLENRHNHSEKQKEIENGNDVSGSEDSKRATEDLSALMEYLNKDVWEKENLDSFEQTQGLFDVMNCFNIQGIIDMLDKDELKNVENVKNLVEAAKNCSYDPSEGGKKKNNKNPNDLKIKISKYIDKLKTPPSRTEEGKSKEGTTSSKAGDTSKSKKEKEDDETSSTGSKTNSSSSGTTNKSNTKGNNNTTVTGDNNNIGTGPQDLN